MKKNNLETTRLGVALPLLDSSLITQSKLKKHPLKNYDVKLINCGDYVQLYFFKKSKSKNDGLFEKQSSSVFELEKIDTDNLIDKSKPLLTNIHLKNIMRSKLQCQRLAKSNIKEWHSFITLTFADNVTDIKTANKIFNTWRTAISQIKADFKYLAVPEFQERGAVHYHILSNISINDTEIVLEQKDNSKYYDIKYWKYGFSAFDSVTGDAKKIIGYIAKYMTKDADKRLYGHRRYLNSNNLNRPAVSYIDLNQEKDLNYLDNLINGMKISFEKTYFDTFSNQDINYLELEI